MGLLFHFRSYKRRANIKQSFLMEPLERAPLLRSCNLLERFADSSRRTTARIHRSSGTTPAIPQRFRFAAIRFSPAPRPARNRLLSPANTLPHHPAAHQPSAPNPSTDRENRYLLSCGKPGEEARQSAETLAVRCTEREVLRHTPRSLHSRECSHVHT